MLLDLQVIKDTSIANALSNLKSFELNIKLVYVPNLYRILSDDELKVLPFNKLF